VRCPEKKTSFFLHIKDSYSIRSRKIHTKTREREEEEEEENIGKSLGGKYKTKNRFIEKKKRKIYLILWNKYKIIYIHISHLAKL
jgi:hypothetical protein